MIDDPGSFFRMTEQKTHREKILKKKPKNISKIKKLVRFWREEWGWPKFLNDLIQQSH